MSGVSFEDSDVVRSAIRVEGFRDDEFNYQLIRALGVADYGGSTVGECLAVVAEIADGSPRAGPRPSSAWPTGSRNGPGPASEDGRRVSGRDHLLRASTYYRTAEYYADGVSGRSLRMGERSQACFADAAGLFDPPIELVDVPFEGGTLPGLPGPSGAGCAPGGRSGSHPDRGGRLRLQRRGALLPPGGAGCRTGMERVRLRRSRAARGHATRPGHDLPARLRGADRRGDRPSVPAGRCRRRSGGAGRAELRLVLRGPERGHRSVGCGPWWPTLRCST